MYLKIMSVIISPSLQYLCNYVCYMQKYVRMSIYVKRALDDVRQSCKHTRYLTEGTEIPLELTVLCAGLSRRMGLSESSSVVKGVVLYHRFEVWALTLGPYLFLPCSGGL